MLVFYGSAVVHVSLYLVSILFLFDLPYKLCCVQRACVDNFVSLGLVGDGANTGLADHAQLRLLHY